MTPIAGASGLVLLVEDNPGDADLVRELLDHGSDAFQSVHASRMSEALDVLGATPVDAVLLDLSLPDRSGVENVRAIRKVAAQLPIVVLTGLDDEVLALACIDAGAQDYLVKGEIRPAALRRALNYAITRLREAHARERLAEQLRQAQKMEAIGQLAGGIAHDFNNLLTVLTMCAENALEQLEPDHPVTPHVTEILAVSEKAAKLTRRLLTFARPQAGSPRPTNLNQVVTSLKSMLARLIGEHIRVETTLDPSLGQALVDPDQLEQVIANLAVNARDAMPRGGVLRFTTASTQVNPDFAGSVGIAPGPYAVLTVADTGEGMAREVAARVFEPFFTTKKEHGTGLGLAMVHGIVKRHAGHIQVSSEPGRGTTFTILLPHADAARESTAPVVATAALPGGTETVLVVEDEPSVRGTTALMLRRHGYRVEEAANGDEALAIWSRRGADIDLVLTDLVIPGMTGSELALRLSALRPGLPVIYTSGYSGDALDRHGLAEQSTALLPKPYTQAALLQKVRAVLDSSARP